jgi:hypothetical protein
MLQCPLRLGQPEGHVHGVEQLDSSGQFGAGLLRPSHLEMQLPEAEVAVGYQRAHAEFVS